MSFRKGYNTVRFTKLPPADRSVDTVFVQYAGNPYVGLIFSFDRPMQYLLLSGGRTVGNLKALEFRPQLHDLHEQGFRPRYDRLGGGGHGAACNDIPWQGAILTETKNPPDLSGGFF